MTKHQRGATSKLKVIAQTMFHNRDKTIKQKQTVVTSNWIVIEGRCTERGHWTDNGPSVLGLMAHSFTAFYCLVTHRQQMCLHNLYYLSLTSCQHVCVETIEGLPQRHMCRGCDWEVVWICGFDLKKWEIAFKRKTSGYFNIRLLYEHIGIDFMFVQERGPGHV